MKLRQLALCALLAGTLASCTVYSQSPYSQPPYDSGRPGADPSYSDPYPDYGYDDAPAPTEDVGFFYEELAPYGEWIRRPQYGWVWFPRHVSADWRPYSYGRWVDSDYGWTWASDEPFGWATYHYGRWAWDPEIGWVWVPGTVWGPAWVAWRNGEGYVGWAPLPPSVGFEFGIGLRLGGLDLNIALQPSQYSFVPERSFMEPRLNGYILPPAHNVTIIQNTTNITNYSVVGDRVVNRGVPVDRIERAIGRHVQRMQVAPSPTQGATRVQGDRLPIYRPPANRLQTVRVAERTNAGLPPAPPPPRPNRRPSDANPSARPNHPQPHPAATPLPGTAVAPHPQAQPRHDDIEGRHQRELRDQQAENQAERRRLEQLQQQEAARNQAQANAQELARRHAAELKAQEEEQRRAAQQLQTRQKIEHQAEQEARPARANQPAKPPAKPPKDKDKDKKDNKRDKNDDSDRPPSSPGVGAAPRIVN